MLWCAYALLSHGGDRIALGSIGPASWHRSVTSSFRRSADVVRVLEEADCAIWSASSLSACAESGLLDHLGRPAAIDELARAASLPPTLVGTLIDVLASYGFLVWERNRVRAAPSLMPFTTPEGMLTLRASLRAPLLQKPTAFGADLPTAPSP